MTPQIVFVYARAANGVIGSNGSLPWHLPADLRHFKALTMAKPMIMPGRRHIVLTRDTGWHKPGAEVVHSPQDALAMASADETEIAVIGGGEVFALFTPDRIELTEIHADYTGDTTMPALGSEWREIARDEHAALEGRPGYAFVTLTRHL
jgi:dihydrofolate reductase